MVLQSNVLLWNGQDLMHVVHMVAGWWISCSMDTSATPFCMLCMLCSGTLVRGVFLVAGVVTIGLLNSKHQRMQAVKN